MTSSKFKHYKRKSYIIAVLALILSIEFLVPVPDTNDGTVDMAKTLDTMGYEVAEIEPASGATAGRSLRFVVMESMGHVYEEVVLEDDRDVQDTGVVGKNVEGWSRYRLSMSEDQRPAIAIVIDDVGLDRQRSLRAVTALPPEVTLAYLPYAPELDKQTRLARDFGHELIVHFPMEPLGDSDPGPIALMDGMGDQDVSSVMGRAFASFEGYVGINNHMGSKVTQNGVIMSRVMGELNSRGLFYLDSRTIGGSVAAKNARQNGVPYAVRDIFLDHEETEAFVRSALNDTVAKAKENGFAIAIGHPKDVTLEIVGEWAETLDEQGVRLVPLSEVILYPNANVAMNIGPIGSATVLEN